MPRRSARLRPSKVVSVSYHPIIRPGPALSLLRNFEALSHEQKVLLHAGYEEGLSKPSDAGILWLALRVDTKVVKKQFELSIKEGTRTFEVGNTFWANICWHFAHLQSSDLVYESDLDFWTTFIRCCFLPDRLGAANVAQSLI